ncbi:MAG TPA: cyclic nucleotide-binding domain-containing protein [Anaeromyxobacteraceae bacterium]|nr:cyclic nucleotide-binding domain-containing protein [Anaeromyxobacteraceae bacterium]
MVDLRKLKDKAADLAARGKLDKAADVFRRALDGDPDDIATRQKLADVLRRSGRVDEAVEQYGDVADRYGRDGLLIKAIAISKTILELDPEHVDTQTALADLYARRAKIEAGRPPVRQTLMMAAVRAAPAGPPAPPQPPADTEDRMVAIPLGPVPPPLPPEPPRPPVTPLDAIVAAAASTDVEEEIVIEAEPFETAGGAESLDPYVPPPAPFPGAPDPTAASRPTAPAAPEPPSAPPAGPPPAEAGIAPSPAGIELPRVPIFSDLSRDAFVALTTAMALRRVAPGEAVIQERDTGTSFYVVAGGRLSVSKRNDRGEDVAVARLGEGDFFGEMALLSGAPRSATVAAEEPSEVLEFSADVLAQIARKHPHVAESLRRFYRQRLLANAMAMSPVFRPFGKGDRKLIMERFRTREVREGEVVIREGEPSDGLYVVLEGAVDVTKRGAGVEVAVGRLSEGDLFGEMSCLRKSPATASVVVIRAGTLLRLPRRDFDEIVVTYPQVLELVAELSEERSENLDAILSGRAEWTEDGLVLV